MMQALSEIDRRLANLLRYGVIAQLDEANARATVDLGEVTTDWLPWFALRAGPDTSWWAPEPGEQVMVFSPSGELAMGTIMPGIYSNAHPANGNAKTLRRTTYADGTVVQYDRAAHEYLIQVQEGGSITLQMADTKIVIGGGSVQITGNTKVNGNLAVSTGASGTFTTPNGDTVTVQDGIITNID